MELRLRAIQESYSEEEWKVAWLKKKQRIAFGSTKAPKHENSSPSHGVGG